MLREERDDGRVAFLLRDGQRLRSVLLRPVDLRAVVQQQPRHVDAARLLLEKGAKLDRATEDGQTPLSIAKSKDNSSIVALLEAHRK